jgi:DNA-binding HxlR family transcriptional regulator
MIQKEFRSPCPIANALEVIGDKWSLLVIRDLMLLDKHEYGEFLEGAEGISTNILADRLKRLTIMGIIAVVPHPANKTRKFYYLTRAGKDLLPLVTEMILWGGTYVPSPDMPQAKFDAVRRNPKQFMAQTLKGIAQWEKEHLGHSKSKS